MINAIAAPGHQPQASRLCLLLVLLAATIGCSGTVRSQSLELPRTPTPTQASSGWQLSPGESLIAVAKRSSIQVLTRSTGAVRWRLRNPNADGAPLMFLVIAQQDDGWKVRVPTRPNGAVGWVRDNDVELKVDPYDLRVSLRRHALSVYDGGRLIRTFPVGVGTRCAPTPPGRFFLTELLIAANPTGPYGPYAYGTSAFSDVFSEFEGGPGQIGVHGTNDPSSIGRNVSNGCIRLRVQDIRALAHMVPAGTPLTISP